MSTDPNLVLEKLTEPFAADEVKWKPQAVKGNRAMAICYIDVRAVADRLDEVLGLDWSDEYAVLADKSVTCRLTIRVGDRTITREDVGSQSEQPDGGDRMKAAYSDALKRAAVKFGIGRYLYRLPNTWVDYDPIKKQLSPPRLPPWALPATRKPVDATTSAARPAIAVGGQSAAVPTENASAAAIAAVAKGLFFCHLDWASAEVRHWIDEQLDELGKNVAVIQVERVVDLTHEQAEAVQVVLVNEYRRQQAQKKEKVNAPA